MRAAWAMASLTSDTTFQKRGRIVGILRLRPMLHSTRVALQATRNNRTRQKRLVIATISRRQIPRCDCE